MSKAKAPALSSNHTPKEAPISFEELVLNYTGSRYRVVPLAARWAKVLEKLQEYKPLKKNELIELALQDVLSGKTGLKEIEKEEAKLLKTQDEEEKTKAQSKIKENKKEEEKTKEKGSKETGKKK